MIDPQADKKLGTWYPNYGEWRVEWEELSKRLELPELKSCTTHEWEKTDCFFGGSHDIPEDYRLTLDRAYVRLDRLKLQSLLRTKYDKAGGICIPSKLESNLISNNLFDQNIKHDVTGTDLILNDGSTVRCKILIDASGFESPLIKREEPMLARGNPNEMPTGYQIAYGFTAEVSSPGPYDMEAMTLFDYRTKHALSSSNSGDNSSSSSSSSSSKEWYKDVCERPTFMYAMPFKKIDDNRYEIFFEETSLVGKDERRLSFEECKKRAMARLASHNMQILALTEEEYCYIPMGGELPDLTQRIIAFGGAANMVHPSTGYQACRMLAASTDVASAIGSTMKKGHAPDAVSAAAYSAMWSQKTRTQRDFQSYGGDFLMRQPVEQLRGFFDAFFAVETDIWGGFLAGWPGLPGNVNHESWNSRLQFAIKLFLKMPNSVRIAMILYSIEYTLQFGPGTLLRSLTPGFLTGNGPAPPNPEEVQRKISSDSSSGSSSSGRLVGDMEAKEEAKRMMKAFVPITFSSSSSSSSSGTSVE